MGGEACPPELAARLVGARPRGVEHLRPDRGDGGRLRRAADRRRGRCGSGCRSTAGTSRWSTPTDSRSPGGATGELIIGGVGLARYLDPAKDAEKYAPMPTLGWDRAYRSGDLVVNDEDGLLFVGRADDQVKLGGRRIELGEIDYALLDLPGVNGAAAAVRRTAPATSCWSATSPPTTAFDQAQAMELLRHPLPAALVPRLAVVDVAPDPHLRQDRPRRAALAAARRGRGPAGRRRAVARHDGLARRPVARGARRRRP